MTKHRTFLDELGQTGNVFYARARQMMLVAKQPVALRRSYVASNYIYFICNNNKLLYK